MDDPDPDCALVEAEPAHDLQRVVVPVPRREAAIAEEGRNLLRRAPGVREGERRHASLHRRRAVEPAVVREAGEKAFPELPLPGTDGVEPDRAEVIHRGDEPGEELVRERPRLVAVTERLVRRGTDLVRTPPLEQLCPAEREAEVGAAELVR